MAPAPSGPLFSSITKTFHPTCGEAHGTLLFFNLNVCLKLAKDARLGTLTGIEVNTTKGVVTLAGKVKDKSEKKQAAKIAKSIKGVKSVKNELQVVK